MTNKWIDALKEEVSKHNTTAALREMVSPGLVGPEKKLKTPECRTDKTDKTTGRHKTGVQNLRTPKPRTDKTDKTLTRDPEFSGNAQMCTAKTAKTTEAECLGLIATWSIEFGYISIHDPTTGEWWDLPTADAPAWAKSEAFKRKELYKEGNRKAYRLTSEEMAKIWEAEHVPEPEGIVEDHPIEEEED